MYWTRTHVSAEYLDTLILELFVWYYNQYMLTCGVVQSTQNMKWYHGGGVRVTQFRVVYAAKRCPQATPGQPRIIFPK